MMLADTGKHAPLGETEITGMPPVASKRAVIKSHFVVVNDGSYPTIVLEELGLLRKDFVASLD